jgi:hypothetical protein
MWQQYFDLEILPQCKTHEKKTWSESTSIFDHHIVLTGNPKDQLNWTQWDIAEHSETISYQW